MSGPLRGLRVLELAGQGPGPFGAMMLADMGADVVRVDRPQHDPSGAAGDAARRYVLHRGRRSITADLKQPGDVEMVSALADRADALIDPYRPGVTERLGLGPVTCLQRNRRLVYARMTGWGQDGPLRDAAGHDIDYIALAGALRSFARRDEAPVAPLTTVGDAGGGGMLLALGILAAVWEADRSGEGQVLDVAIVDGAALLMMMIHGMAAQGRWNIEPGTNFADSGSPYYDVYKTADDEYLAVGALEETFYDELLAGLQLDPADLPDRQDRTTWPALKQVIADRVRTRTRSQWEAAFADLDACVAPVLSMADAPLHPHNVARATFVERYGVVQPAPAPRFSRTPSSISHPPPVPGEHTEAVLRDWGVG